MHPHPCVCRPIGRLFPYSVSSFSPKWYLPTLPLCLHLTLFSHLVLGLVDIRFPRCFPVKVLDVWNFFFTRLPHRRPLNFLLTVSRDQTHHEVSNHIPQLILFHLYHVLCQFLPQSETPPFTPTQNPSSKWNTTFYTHTKKRRNYAVNSSHLCFIKPIGRQKCSGWTAPIVF